MADKVNIGGATERPPRGEDSPRTKRAGSGSRTGASARGGASSPPPPQHPPKQSLKGDDKKLHTALVQMYAGVGMGVQGLATMRQDFGLSIAGANIAAMADDTATAWVELAQQNPRVKQMLQGFIQGSAVATLVGCHASMLLPVLAARGVVPGEVANMFLTPTAMEYAATMRAGTSPPNGNHSA